MNPDTPTNAPPGYIPVAVLLVGVGAVSTGAIFARMAEAPALVTAAYRTGIAALILVPAAAIVARRELAALGRADLLRAAGAGLFLALHFATWISSLDHTSVAASVILVNTNPLWVGLLTPLLTRDRITPRGRVGILLSVVGAVVIGYGDLAGGGRALVGDLLALAGSLFAALYLLMGRRLRPHLSLLAYTSLCYGCAAVFLWLLVLVLRLPATGFTAGTWGAFLAMALVSQLLGHTCYNWGLRWFSAGMIAVSLLGEPVGATLLAWLLFAESLTAAKWIGGALILAAVFVTAAGESGPDAGGRPAADDRN